MTERPNTPGGPVAPPAVTGKTPIGEYDPALKRSESRNGDALTASEIDLIEACLDDGIYTKQEQKDFRALCRMARASVSEKGTWIPVGERLPDCVGTYLVCVKPLLEDKPIVKMSMYVPPAHKSINGFRDAPVTHWMPLPEAPK